MIVVDASVAVKWVVQEPESELSAGLLDRSDLLGPDLLLVEAANVFRRKAAAGMLSDAQALAGLALISQRVGVIPVSPPLAQAALSIALRMGHSVYDCIYLAIAQSADARLVSLDQELVRRVRRIGLGDLLADISSSGNLV